MYSLSPNRLKTTAMRLNAAYISQSLEEKPQKQKKPGSSPGFSLRQALNADYSAAHSHRSATSGSTFVARRAGIQQATSATRTSDTAVAPNVEGSVALTPNSSVDIKRVNAKAATNPVIMPII